MSVIVGIDIGGTFTDVVAYDVERQRLAFTKVPSTPPDFVDGFIRGLKKAVQSVGRTPGDVTRIIHGTTVSLNAILEQKGAVLGMLVTAGTEDTLAIGRQKRTVMYDLFLDPETPTFLCPRRRIAGIHERIGADGAVVKPVDEEEVAAAVRRLKEQHGVEALVICSLFSFLNPDHEARMREVVERLYPDLKVSLSSNVDPRFREFERLLVTAFDAYVKPVVEDYVGKLDRSLAEEGVAAGLQIMQSRGGITSAATVVDKPITTIMSGPAAGVIGGNFVGRYAGSENLITLDIGGTSCDIALVGESKPLISLEGRIGNYPFRQPMIDVSSIGAGGGSIAYVDAAGGLHVGPRSAGARPGPACYARGGTEPTVTDASVLLGYLSPERFGYGEIQLQPDLARTAVERVAERIGLDVDASALGIHRIVNARMADELRLVSIKRGYDPRDFALVALGGGGPVHAAKLAELLHIPRVIVPTAPGVLSAFGLLVANVEHDHARTFRGVATDADPAAIERVFAELVAICDERMARDRVAANQVTNSRSADLRYVGQAYEIEVPFPAGAASPDQIPELVVAFHRKHERIYGYATPERPVEFVSLRVVSACPLPKPAVEKIQRNGRTIEDARTGSRLVLFEGMSGRVETPVYERSLLPVNVEIAGPAIVEQDDTTTVLYPGQRASLDAYANLIITVPPPAAERQAISLQTSTATGRKVDPVTLEVVRHKLDVIADEMELTLLKTSYSSIIKEAIDASAAIFDLQGRTLAQAIAIPAHLGMLIPAVRRLIQAFPPETMQPDDIYIMNDPYDGGTHLPDIVVLTPVFHEGNVVALSANMAHHQDVGGKAPGSTPPDATELFAEGICLPPLKLFDRGVPNRMIFDILRKNVRIPYSMLGDLSAQIACANVGRRRLAELFVDYGPPLLFECVERLMDQAEQLARAVIRQIPDGSYTFFDYLDDNGVDTHVPVRIQATITVQGSDVLVDWTGTDPAAKGALNCVPSSTQAMVYYAVKAICGPEVPNNEGCYRLIRIVAPPGTLVNPDHPHATGARSITMKRLVSVLLGAFARSAPDRVHAASDGQSNLLYVGGFDPNVGKRYVTLIGVPTAGGMGARPTKDGIDVISSDMSNLLRFPIEAFEMDFPFRVGECNLWTDSGGAGRFRGGLGYRALVEVLRGDTTVTHRRDRHDFAPWGLLGGKPSPCCRTILHRADGTREELPSKVVFKMTAGDVLEIFTTGGGGHGDPFDRPPGVVFADVLDLKVSAEAADREYGVVLDAAGQTVDAAATEARRHQMRQARGPITWTFDRGEAFTQRTGLPRLE